VSAYNSRLKTTKRGMSVTFFSRRVVIVAIFLIGVLFAVTALPKGGERRDPYAGSNETPISSQEAEELSPIESHRCSVKSIEPELKVMFDLHQATRDNGARCGSTRMRSASSLRWSCKLAKAAGNHVSDMAKNDFMSHTGSDGSTIGQRATKANYIWRNVGENVAKGFEVPSEVHRLWLESPAHCKIIMSSIYSEMGAAKVGDYWVVMFGRR
jgi:uncharacterized protein YkwD